MNELIWNTELPSHLIHSISLSLFDILLAPFKNAERREKSGLVFVYNDGLSNCRCCFFHTHFARRSRWHNLIITRDGNTHIYTHVTLILSNLINLYDLEYMLFAIMLRNSITPPLRQWKCGYHNGFAALVKLIEIVGRKKVCRLQKHTKKVSFAYTRDSNFRLIWFCVSEYFVLPLPS